MECHTPEPRSSEKTVYTVFWIILLILVAWPLAWLLAPIWIILIALEALFSPVREITAVLEKLITWPRNLGYAIVESRESFTSPLL